MGLVPARPWTDEAQFRLEDTLLHARFGVRPLPHVNFGIEGGALFVNTGPGVVSSGEPTIDQQFDPSIVPGVLEQTDFLSSGVFLQYDYRDNPLGARSGGNYVARFRYFNDRELERHDFRRLDLEAQQFLPFFNKRRVLALRVQTALTFTNGTSRVPFYLQPVLGGSDNLRGFVPFRFYDDNLIVANVEYRWESFSGLDMAVFFDAGKVASRPREYRLDRSRDFRWSRLQVQCSKRHIHSDRHRFQPRRCPDLAESLLMRSSDLI